MTERFFTPESALWRVDREMALLLGGGRALLMQVAHPKIAAGVAEHSHFLEDPLKRLTGTMATMWSIVFDDRPRAEAALERLENIHRRVRGTVHEPGRSPGASYSAGDPDLLLWVHATLIDSALAAYDRFVEPLSVVERRRYYEDSKKLGLLLGVPAAKFPGSYEEFGAYMAAMIASGALAVGPTARKLARAVLHPAPWFLKTVAPLHAFITAGLLPPELRRAYGLPWGPGRERALRLVAGTARAALPLVPSVIRVVPRARAAEARAGDGFRGL